MYFPIFICRHIVAFAKRHFKLYMGYYKDICKVTGILQWEDSNTGTLKKVYSFTQRVHDPKHKYLILIIKSTYTIYFTVLSGAER